MKEIPFDVLRMKAVNLAESKRSNATALFSEIAQRINRGDYQGLKDMIEDAKATFVASLSIGTLVEYLDGQEEEVASDMADFRRQMEGKLEDREALIVLKLDKAGVDLSEVVENKDEKVKRGKDITGESAEEEEREGIEAIRANLGKPDAFKTGDSELDQRLEQTSRGFIPGVINRDLREKLGKEGSLKVIDILGQTESQLLKITSVNRRNIEFMLAKLYKAGILPVENNAEVEKAKEIERIRKNLGNVEAFETGDPEVDARLDKPFINTFRVGITYIILDDLFGKNYLDVSIKDILSLTESQIFALKSMGEFKFNKLLNQLHEMGIIPDEKWNNPEDATTSSS